MKRLDVGVMTLVAYTSLAPDDRAKLLLFPILSALQLALTAWFKPFANDQAELLDFLDTFLLALRFFCFSAMAVLILLSPSPDSTQVVAMAVFLILVIGCWYFVLHVASQLLRKFASSWAEDLVSSRRGQELQLMYASVINRGKTVLVSEFCCMKEF